MSIQVAPAAARSVARRPPSLPQAAFVLHRYDWSESSLILDLFTRESGRVAAAAKGAKRPYSQMRSVLMPFQRIMVQFGRPRAEEAAEVRTLRAVEWAGQGVALEGAAWFAGFYLNELLMRLLARDDAHPRLFDAYALTLRTIGRGAQGCVEAALRAFELLLLRETGVLPQLDRATLTQTAVAPERWYTLRPDQGLVETTGSEAALSGTSCLALQAALDELSVEPTAGQLDRLHAASAEALAGLKLQLRQQLHYHLGGAALRTRQVMIDSFRLLGLDASAPTR